MASSRSYKQSFNGGEVTPEFWGQITDGKFQSGVALLRNFIALPHGPAENRAGTAYVNVVKNSANAVRLIPFTFSTTQTMVIELGSGYIRFHTQGGTLMAPAAAAWNIALAYPQGSLVSYSGSTYYSRDPGGSPAGTLPTNVTYWYQLPASGEYEIPGKTYTAAQLFDAHYVQSADVLTFVHPSIPPYELRRYGATDWRTTDISFAAGIAAPTGVTVTANNVPTGNTLAYTYVVTAVAADQISESVASSSASANNNLFGQAANNTVSWSAVAGASRYNVYRYYGGLYGYIGSVTTTSLIDSNIAPDVSKTPPTYETTLSTANNYPGAVTYFEQRRCFAGTNNSPQSLWMTKSGTESAMSYSIPTRDDDRINIRVAAREANTIRHLIPLNNLIALTSAAEWSITSVNSDALTPTSIAVRPQSYIGASNVQPTVINNTMVYAAARGGHVRELGYNWQAGGYLTGDLSLRAPHLFDDLTIVDQAYQKSPYPVVWFVSSNGKLLGITYIPEQQIGAWHQHDTDGVFESVCCVAEGSEDAVYVVVRRTVNGSSVRYIERMESRNFVDPKDAFFVDCGGVFDGTNTTATTVTVSGGTTWGPADVLTLTASAVLFAYPAQTDAGDVIVFTDANGVEYSLTIQATTSGISATAIVDKVLPVGYRNVAQSSYCFERSTISGLSFLEGKTVSVLGDGAVMPQVTVSGGSITLSHPVGKAIVGLPITADMQTLPLALGTDSAYGQGRQKNVNRVALRVYRSSGIFAGPNLNALVQYKQRTTEPYGSAPELRTDEIDITLSPSWNNAGAQVYIRQSDPLPLTLVSMTIDVTMGD